MQTVVIEQEWIKRAIANRGDWTKIEQVMKRARKGEAIKIAFIGGSITQGSLSSSPQTCYAYLVYEWWKETFSEATVSYLNAGIGGTTSQFGVARVEDHVLCQKPDLVIVEFSVNDTNDSFFLETFEGLIRRIVSSDKSPAVVIVNNVHYQDGSNAQEIHNKIGGAYQIPCISIKDAIYPLIIEKKLKREDLTPDNLHPNDTGHALVAGIITGFFKRVQDTLVRSPLTSNQYEHSIRYQSDHCLPKLDGFMTDESVSKSIQDVFKNGWFASAIGASITFSVKGTGIAVQYRKSVKQPAPVARAVIDGDVERAVILDANFTETWGDCLYLETIYFHGEDKEHQVTIEIVEGTEEDVTPFYLVSVIVSSKKSK
ncbi:MAG: acyl-CoA thioesterase [Clostridiales bacterium]|nr:acyl-CoA thioesterase [Clostridiales bacterium]